MRLICLMCVLVSLSAAADADYNSARALQQASVDKQLASARAQHAASARNSSIAAIPFDAPAPEPFPEQTPAGPCDSSSPYQIREIIDEGAKRSGLDTDLVRAVVRKESAYNPCATSNKGAQGLMQLMPSVQAQFGVTNPYDPRQNVDAGTKLLKQLLDQYGGDLSRALSAYNAGPARVAQYDGVPPFPETIRYVSGILDDLATK